MSRPAASYPAGGSLLGLQLPPKRQKLEAPAPECVAVGRTERSCREANDVSPVSLHERLQDMGLSTASGIRPSPLQTEGPTDSPHFSMPLPPMLPPEEIERRRAGLRMCTPVDPQCPTTTTPEGEMFQPQISSSGGGSIAGA